jgi:A/G-specific adenine glycosylase
MPTISSDHAGLVRRGLLAWFRSHARRLPWRQNPSPYAIWVSEVMLQQTQVEAVIPFYERFLHAFPTVESLAQAPTEQVLKLWSGLGYYRRARHLHAAAKTIVARFGGRFPRDYQAACSLPGVGDYTARAVLSIAYGLPYAVLDGNVARVLARLQAIEGHANQPRFRSAVTRELELLLSRRRPGDFNQALMELGQTVCLPRAPHCADCPLSRWCQARRLSRQESYPFPKPRRATESAHLAVAILRRESQQAGPFAAPLVAMVRGLDDGLLVDLWNFPSAFGSSAQDARHRLQMKLEIALGAPVSIGQPLGDVRHGITYRSIQARLYEAELAQRCEPEKRDRPGGPDGQATEGAVRWFPIGKVAGSAVSQLARKIAAAIR